jgi:SAM-dependent methyltransferase
MTEETHAVPAFLRDLFGWYSMVLLGLGRRTGLLDALLSGPGTAEEIAARAGVDTRNALEWLRGLAASGHVSHAGGVFRVDQSTAMMFSPAFPVDARSVVDFTVAAPSLYDEVVAAMQAGSGVPFGTFDALSALAGKVNGPTYVAALVGEWIAAVPGLTEQLEAGAAIADLASGNGDAAVLLAKAFPQSRVVGYDIVAMSRVDLPSKVHLRVADARDLPDDGPFGLVICLDSFHHLGDPAPVLAQVRKVLAPGGVLMIVESDLSGDLDADSANPFAVVIYACGLLYCLQENLAAGGSGRSNGDGPGWVTEAMTAAGFDGLMVTPSEAGYNVITGRA